MIALEIVPPDRGILHASFNIATIITPAIIKAMLYSLSDYHAN